MVSMSMFAICLSANAAIAQDAPDYGFDFVTIGDPGNRDTIPSETPHSSDFQFGSVDYVFRMATTEVTLGQYLEFVQAYYPIEVKNTGNPIASLGLTGFGIRAAFGQVHIRDGHTEHEPTSMSWEYAARYINWLHNGKVQEEWAYENGVYDTSTFVQDEKGNWLHQQVHNPHSRYWMPTYNEWMKAGYWDPNKNDGKGGYWIFPNTSDIEPIPRLLPNEGGGRNSGRSSEGWPIDVGSFENVASPWGIYDMAGGVSEFTESVWWFRDPVRLQERIVCGSYFLYDDYGDIFSNDIIGFAVGYSVSFAAFNGLRLVRGMEHPADLNHDGHMNYFDVSLFMRWYISGDDRADFRLDGELDLDDARVFLGLMGFHSSL